MVGSLLEWVPPMAAPLSAQVAWWLAFAGYLSFAAASIVLAVIDLRQHRLPDAIVLPSLGVVTLLLGGASIVAGDWPRLWVTLGTGAGLFAVFFVLAVVSPSGLGGGDVKLAALVGVALGYAGWNAVLIGVLGAFALATLLAAVLLLRKKQRRATSFAFGPCMLAGAWIGLVWESVSVPAALG